VKVAVYDLYWSTFGGGEQVDGTIAQVLSGDHDVTLLGPGPVDVERFKARLGIDLSGCAYRKVTDDIEAGEASADFDLFINGTYLSKAVNQATHGWYYVHFPGLATGKSAQRRNKLYMGAVKALAAPARYVEGVREWQAAFDRRIERFHFLPTYQHFLANSSFTASWVERLWGVPSTVLYPPVRPTIKPGDKSNTILSLGRFFDPSHGHCKKQLDLVEAFRRLHESGAAPGWELALVGGANASDREYVLQVRRAAQGLPIRIALNAPGPLVESLLAESSIFWHAGGYGEDPEVHPERFEHFGIALVEAMSAGAVPVVYGAAGPAEIVRNGVDGWHWNQLDQAVTQTAALIADPSARSTMANSAVTRAADFSAAVFADGVRSLIS
jgi:glycosyltransferase involved in cell wall biosynthesis